MKAIQIKYLGPTNTLGARLKVWAGDCPVKYMPRDYSIDVEVDATYCARLYMKLMGWQGDIAFGTLPNGDYVAVMKGE